MHRPVSAKHRVQPGVASKSLGDSSRPLARADALCTSPAVAKATEQDGGMLLLFKISFPWLARMTCALIGGGLLACFLLTIVDDNFRDVELACNATSAVPSFGEVTSLKPQRYLWRVAVALHSAPRFILALVYWRHFKPLRSCAARILSRAAVWLYLAESGCLVGMTYIPGEENRPIYEAMFSSFIATSLFHQLLMIALFHVIDLMAEDANGRWSYNMKRVCFLLNLLLCLAMLGFSALRSLCAPHGFLAGILCEYGVLALNTLFHLSAVYEFRAHSWHVLIRKKIS